MTNVILFTAFLLAAAFFALAAGELRGIRQTVRKRCDRLTAELHTVEALLAEHRGILDGLKSGSEASDAAYTAFFRSLEARQMEIHKVVCPPADTGSDRQSGSDCQSGSDLDSRLSKSMEEGILNLMQYAAGKTSGGVEVGLG